MHSEEITLSSDGLRLAGRMLWPAGPRPVPALVLCHGFGSCKENHAVFAAQAATQGWGVLSFDFRGHGASEGCLDSRTVNDVGAGLHWLLERPEIDAARVGVRGSSMGGYFAIHATRLWPEFGACAAISPPAEAELQALLRDAGDPTTYYGQWRAQGPGFPRVMGCDLACWLEANNLYTTAAGLAPRPLLLIHCAGDAVVPVQVSAALYAAAHEPRALWLLEEGDHCRPSRDAQVATRTLEWFAQALTPGARGPTAAPA